MIPKRIFTYWDGDERPQIVDACIRQMESMHPGWVITVLRREDVCDELPCLRFLSKAHQSDWARVCAIQKHGGVWLDATCICQQPVTAWVNMEASSLQGFSPPFDDTLFENWAFAAPKNSRFLELWKEQVRDACMQGHEAYCSSIPDNILGNLRPHLPYLSMHAGFCLVKYAHPDLDVVSKPSCEKYMPFYYLCSNDWNVDAAIKSLVTARDYAKHKATPLFKMRGVERSRLIELNPIVEGKSIIGRLYASLDRPS